MDIFIKGENEHIVEVARGYLNISTSVLLFSGADFYLP